MKSTSKDRSVALMAFIDQYILEETSSTQYFLKHRKNRTLDNGFDKIYDKLIEVLTIKNTNIDPYYFIADVSDVRRFGVFYVLEQAEEMRKAFKAYDIDIPEDIMRAFNEIEIRAKVSKSIKVDWDANKVGEYGELLEGELKTYAFDLDSRKNYLSKAHLLKIDEIEELKKKSLNGAGYFLDRLFDALKDEEKEKEINAYFHNSHLKGIAFLDAHRILSYYINKRNELKIIQNFISGNKCNTVITLNDLSAFELALRYWYLVEFKKETPPVNGAAVGKIYGHLKTAKNIELRYNDISNKRRSAKKKELQNVCNTLSDHVIIQKAIENAIDKL